MVRELLLIGHLRAAHPNGNRNGNGITIDRRCGKTIQAILRKHYIENTEEERTFESLGRGRC